VLGLDIGYTPNPIPINFRHLNLSQTLKKYGFSQINFLERSGRPTFIGLPDLDIQKVSENLNLQILVYESTYVRKKNFLEFFQLKIFFFFFW